MDLKSLLGYSKGSPYIGNPYLDIHTPDGSITMANTDFDIEGIDEYGNKQIMKARRRKPYKFRGKVVRETPMQYAQQGTIITDNPNDPRIKAYQDSLQAYNFGQSQKAQFLKIDREAKDSKNSNIKPYPKFTKELMNAPYAGSISSGRPAINNFPINAYSEEYIPKDLTIKERLFGRSGTTHLGLSGYQEWAKPVQPVVYQKPQQKPAKLNLSKYDITTTDVVKEYNQATLDQLRRKYTNKSKGELVGFKRNQWGDFEGGAIYKKVEQPQLERLSGKPSNNPYTVEREFPRGEMMLTNNRPADMEGDYMVGYKDNGVGTERAFHTEQQGKTFMEALQSRDLSGVAPSYGNMEGYWRLPKKQVGGTSNPYSYKDDWKYSPEVRATELKRKSTVDKLWKDMHTVTQKPAYISQDKPQSPAQKAESLRKKQVYAANNPNAQVNSKGELEEKNINVQLDNTPYPNSKEERFIKGINHIGTGLEVAGYLTGAGELASAGYRALRKGAAKYMDVIPSITEGNSQRVISSSSGMDAVNATTPGYNSHLFKKQGYIPPTTDPALMAYNSADNLANNNLSISQLMARGEHGKQGLESNRVLNSRNITNDLATYNTQAESGNAAFYRNNNISGINFTEMNPYQRIGNTPNSTVNIPPEMISKIDGSINRGMFNSNQDDALKYVYDQWADPRSRSLIEKSYPKELIDMATSKHGNKSFGVSNPGSTNITTAAQKEMGGNIYEKGGFSPQQLFEFLFDDKDEAPSADEVAQQTQDMAQFAQEKEEFAIQQEEFAVKQKQMEDDMDYNLALQTAITGDADWQNLGNPYKSDKQESEGNPYSNDLSSYGKSYENLDTNVTSATKELLEKFPNLRLTSGRRSWGDKDAHPKGRAVDLSYDDAAYHYYKNVLVPKYGFNEALNPNHGTGKHIHLGYY